ncbi:MAG: GPI anchored serine-threonine rich family protein [bacterium]|nr:GPI anchored serine-threonine rich family protein [bacterium]
MNRILLLIILFVIASSISYSQDLKINNVEFSDNLVKVKYEVVDTLVGRVYTVRAYSSHDNFLNPLKEIGGDVGHEILPGGERTLTWDAIKELGQDFDGDVSIELRARIYVPFIHVPWFQDVKTLKKKVEYNVTWAGGRSGNVLNFDLYNSKNEKVATFPNVANVGHYNLNIPNTVKPGKGYRFRISDSKNQDEVVFTPTFSIQRKVPLFVSVLVPVLTAGATSFGVLQLLPQESTPISNDIPDPILPSGQN